MPESPARTDYRMDPTKSAEVAQSFDPTPKRDPTKDPRCDDKLGHRDGGTMYVLYRTPKMVCIARRPDWYSYGDKTWMLLSTFQKLCNGEVF